MVRVLAKNGDPAFVGAGVSLSLAALFGGVEANGPLPKKRLIRRTLAGGSAPANGPSLCTHTRQRPVLHRPEVCFR
jgi:hypothetical protein